MYLPILVLFSDDSIVLFEESHFFFSMFAKAWPDYLTGSPTLSGVLLCCVVLCCLLRRLNLDIDVSPALSVFKEKEEFLFSPLS